MQLRRGGGGEPQHQFDHRIGGDGAFGDAAVQLDAGRLQHACVGATCDPIEGRLLDHDRDALGRHRRAAHARLAERPVGDVVRRPSRLGDGEGTGEFADQERRLVDLRRHQQARGLERERRLAAVQLHGRLDAAHLEAEGIPADGLCGTAINAAGLGLARAPALQGLLRRRGGIEPQPGPDDGERHHEDERHQDRPKAAAMGQLAVNHRSHSLPQAR